MMKKMAFLIYCGDKDEYATLLPSIMEKLVETLKAANQAINVWMSFFLALRAIIIRTSALHLAPYWPNIIVELVCFCAYIYLWQNMLLADAKKSDPQLVLEALKFIDLATVVIPDEFQPHKWMFIDYSPVDVNTEGFVSYLNQYSSKTAEVEPIIEKVAQSLTDMTSKHPYDKRKPFKITRSPSTGELASANLLATSLIANERRQYLNQTMMHHAASSFNMNAVEFVMDFDFVELSQDDLDKINAQFAQQKQLPKQHLSVTSHSIVSNSTDPLDFVSIDVPKSAAKVNSNDTWIYIDTKQNEK